MSGNDDNRNGLDGQVALVTGATGGLGRAIALQLARDGAEIVVHGRSPERGAQVVAAIESEGGTARFVAADLGAPAAIGEFAAQVGDIDVLVNNAGFSAWGPTDGFDIAAFDDRFAGNVRAPFYLVAAFVPAMAARGRGSVINIGSMAGTLGLPPGRRLRRHEGRDRVAHESWAAEFSPSGVRVNTVAPGPIYTRPQARELFDRLGETTALQRAAQPQEIAEVVAFLASPRASYVTGAIVAADGGRTAI